MAIKRSTYLRKLIGQGENQQLDFKFGITDSKKIARTLSAFSNTDGGRLLIGVKDNGAIAGIRSDEEFYMIEAAAQMYCKPAIMFESKSHKVENNLILEIYISKNITPPVLAPGKGDKWYAYIRVNDENILANRVLMKYWDKKKKDDALFIKLSDSEKLLLNYLEEHQSISLSKFTRISQLTRNRAEHILAEFMIMDLIRMEISENKTNYKLISTIT